MKSSKIISLMLVFSILSLSIFMYVPEVSANSDDFEEEFNQQLSERINLRRINQAGEKLEDSGKSMRHSTYLSLGSATVTFLGMMFAVESPELGSLMMLAGSGMSIWSWIEGFQAQGELRDGGEELKKSVNSPNTAW